MTKTAIELSLLFTALCMILWLLFVPESQAVEVRRVTFEAAEIHNYRHNYFPEYTLLNGKPGEGSQRESWDYHVGLGLELNLITTDLGTLYWDQLVEAESTTAQYRRTAWVFEWGINFGEFEVYHSHESQHILDAVSDQKYPLKDLIGVRICFAGSECMRR